MIQWLHVAMHLRVEAAAARRDARIRFLNTEVDILRRRLGGNRVVPSPADRTRLLAVGLELGHHVADIIGIVTPRPVVPRPSAGGTACPSAGHLTTKPGSHARLNA